MGKAKILIVEDNPDILELVAYNFESQGYEIIKTTTGENALVQAKAQKPDLVVLDLMLPGIDGFSVCRKLKQMEETRSIPVIMLTAKNEESDVVTGLELGADDYIPKPFSPKVLLARARAALRRTHEPEIEENLLKLDALCLDVQKHLITLEGVSVNLSATEFGILKHLMSHPDWVFSRAQIIDAVRGGNYPVTERSVDVQILGIRKKLGAWGDRIETVRGVGYRLRSTP